MKPKEFFELVADMRSWQKQYFRTRDNRAKDESIVREKKVDAEIARVRAILAGLPEKEPSLFPTDEK